MDILEKRDVMLHLPYHSFDSIIDLLREAAIDPFVQSIRITCYRLAKNSKIVNALINAVRNGKQVTVVLELRAGTGGDEAALFVAEVFRMYMRFAEQHRWKVEVLSETESGIGNGLKDVTAIIEGHNVYSQLKYESGVHRVQRVPATETQGRVHTSAITVAVLPEAEEVDVKIEAKDLRIDTFCSSGPGGQSVNTTYSAVRITHLPTNTVVSCQDEKSQIKNREKGMRVLRARLYEVEKERIHQIQAKDRKQQIGSGDRSEKIRTYNFPQNRMTDHRIGLTNHQLAMVMEGQLQPTIDALIAHYTAEKLKANAAAD